MNLEQILTELNKYQMFPPTVDETHSLIGEIEKSRNEYYGISHLTQLRDRLDTVIKALETTELYKTVLLIYLNEIYRQDGKEFHQFPDRYSEAGVCVAFWYGGTEPPYPPDFMSELTITDSLTEIAQYVLFRADCIGFFKHKGVSLSYRDAVQDAASVIQLLIEAGY